MILPAVNVGIQLRANADIVQVIDLALVQSGDRAGIVGEDGETHQGIFDVSFLSAIPNVKIYSPGSYEELKKCTDRAVNTDTGVVCVRYPRGNDRSENESSYITTSFTHEKNNSDTLIITYGRLYNEVCKARKKLIDSGISVDILKLVQINPIKSQVKSIVSEYKKVYFFEEGILNGSVGQRLASVCKNVEVCAIKDFVPQASVDEALDFLELSGDKIYDKIKADLYENKA